MKSLKLGAALVAVLGIAACATSNTSRPTDTGSMALPNYRGGVLDTTTVQGRDVGSMSTPNNGGGVVVPRQNVPDTGSMQLPANASGNSSPGRYRP